MQSSRDTKSPPPLRCHAFYNLNSVFLNNVYKRNIIFTLTTILIVLQTDRQTDRQIVLQQHKIVYNQTEICGVSHKKKLTHVCPLRVAYLPKFSKCLLEITYIMGEGSNFFLFYKRALHASLRTDTCHRNGTRGTEGTSQHSTARCTKPGSIHPFCSICNTFYSECSTVLCIAHLFI